MIAFPVQHLIQPPPPGEGPENYITECSPPPWGRKELRKKVYIPLLGRCSCPSDHESDINSPNTPLFRAFRAQGVIIHLKKKVFPQAEEPYGRQQWH